MLIRRSHDLDGNLLPRAWNILASISDEHSYHLAHGKRHPKSAYLTSLRAIAEQWLKVLDAIDTLHSEHSWQGKESTYPALLCEYRELLYRLNEHFDACYSALRSLCAPSAANGSKFDSQFLDKAKLPGWKQFRDSVKAYRDNHIGLLVNTLKHSQGELCSIFFYSVTEFRPGYYLQDILPNGALGPSLRLHKDANTAFSFSRDLMVHLWWLYRTGDLLANTVTGALHALHKTQLSEQCLSAPDIRWEALLGRCAKLRPEFFPDEVDKPYPRVLFQPNGPSVSIEFPTAARGHRVGPMQVRTQLTVDGEHPSNKLPYFGKGGYGESNS